jgi:hypothetical protein
MVLFKVSPWQHLLGHANSLSPTPSQVPQTWGPLTPSRSWHDDLAHSITPFPGLSCFPYAPLKNRIISQSTLNSEVISFLHPHPGPLLILGCFRPSMSEVPAHPCQVFHPEWTFGPSGSSESASIFHSPSWNHFQFSFRVTSCFVSIHMGSEDKIHFVRYAESHVFHCDYFFCVLSAGSGEIIM